MFVDVYDKHIELFLDTTAKGALRPFTEWSLNSDEICRGAGMIGRVFGLQTSEEWDRPYNVLDDDGDVEIYRIDRSRANRTSD